MRVRELPAAPQSRNHCRKPILKANKIPPSHSLLRTGNIRNYEITALNCCTQGLALIEPIHGISTGCRKTGISDKPTPQGAPFL